MPMSPLHCWVKEPWAKFYKYDDDKGPALRRATRSPQPPSDSLLLTPDLRDLNMRSLNSSLQKFLMVELTKF